MNIFKYIYRKKDIEKKLAWLDDIIAKIGYDGIKFLIQTPKPEIEKRGLIMKVEKTIVDKPEPIEPVEPELSPAEQLKELSKDKPKDINDYNSLLKKI